jgi:hypothetical protein
MQEEGLAGVVLAVVLDPLDRPIGERVGGVEIGAGLDRPAVVIQRFEVEIISPAAGAVGVIETAVHRVVSIICVGGRADVPLADVIRTISRLPQQFGNRHAMLVEPRRVARLVPALEHVSDAGLMRIQPGQQRRPRGATAGRVVELPKADAVLRQPVEVRRGHLAAVAAEVGEPEIVGQNQDDTWF